MLRVGLTGGLACGKTTVAAMMQARGAQVIQADLIARELMQPGQAVYDEVVRRFGEGILHPDGAIDREILAQAAFGGGRIQELNAIVHPAVIERQEQWMAEQGRTNPRAITVVEAALILEAGVRGRFDVIVAVLCSDREKVERYVRRVVPSEAGPLAEIKARKEAQRRLAAQMPDTEKAKVADHVIDNSGSLARTERQVERVMEELKRRADASAVAAEESKP